MSIFDKFKIGFQKSASALTSGLKEIIVKKEINDENLNKIEEFLIRSDVGVEAASEIKEIISRKKINPNEDLTNEINFNYWRILKTNIISGIQCWRYNNASRLYLLRCIYRRPYKQIEDATYHLVRLLLFFCHHYFVRMCSG